MRLQQLCDANLQLASLLSHRMLQLGDLLSAVSAADGALGADDPEDRNDGDDDMEPHWSAQQRQRAD